MKYISVAEAAKKWGVSERSVRGYCAEGKIDGAFLTGKTWNIPETAEKPDRINKHSDAPKTLSEVLKAEKAAKLHGGIYHKIQIDLTYNSNHIEGSRLTHDQTRYIFETNTIGVSDGAVRVDDVVETANHFKCIDMIIDSANHVLSETAVHETSGAEQLNLFTDFDAKEREYASSGQSAERERKTQEAVLSIKQRFGRNAILKGMNLLDGATAAMRNGQIGGHKA